MTEQPTSASLPVLALERLSKSFPGVQALRDVSFAIAGGEIHALLGENGAGKSTLLKIVSGDLHSPLEARKAGIVLIHQELALVPHMSAAANIYLGREVKRGGVTLDRAAMETRAQELVHKLGVEIDVRRPVRTLSMAQRQWVEIARALLYRARVLALDEPTSSLTNRECEALFTILRGLRAEGVAIVYVSHRLEEVAKNRRPRHGHARRTRGRHRRGRPDVARATRDDDGRPRPFGNAANAVPTAGSRRTARRTSQLGGALDRHLVRGPAINRRRSSGAG
jgi:ABC-type branched-subunit amino acid transport system ATPase component